MKQPTQAERVLAYLRAYPLASAIEVAMGCHPWVSNPRARISDLRDLGYDVICERRWDGANGYRIRERQRVTTGVQEGLALS